MFVCLRIPICSDQLSRDSITINLTATSSQIIWVTTVVVQEYTDTHNPGGWWDVRTRGNTDATVWSITWITHTEPCEGRSVIH